MRLLLVADTYPPARISGAVQLHDLVMEMVAQGHRVTVLVPAAGLPTTVAIEQMDGATVLRVRAPQTKDVGLVRRALAEMWLPFALLRGLHESGLAATRWEGVVWYSPTIFLGLVAKRVKRASGCRGYLILRDLFPDWAVDPGIMWRGLAYRLLKHVERYQYRQADVIGVQANTRQCARGRGDCWWWRTDRSAGKLAVRIDAWRRPHFTASHTAYRKDDLCLCRKHGGSTGNGLLAGAGRGFGRSRRRRVSFRGARQRGGTFAWIRKTA